MISIDFGILRKFKIGPMNFKRGHSRFPFVLIWTLSTQSDAVVRLTFLMMAFSIFLSAPLGVMANVEATVVGLSFKEVPAMAFLGQQKGKFVSSDHLPRQFENCSLSVGDG
jgi:hypothetical protein